MQIQRGLTPPLFFYTQIFSIMPKIKLSALASDMKGKANGSVFSKNNGGLYFRNNPNGGGKKSAKWDAQKARFSSLASQWRNLTTTEQDAWNSMSPSYPTTNAFGDPRISSGYELYMRLNGALISQGKNVLSTPMPPRTLPDTGSSAVSVPNEFQLNPIRAARFYNTSNTTNPVYATCAAFCDDSDILSGSTFGIRCAPSNILGNASYNSNRFELMRFTYDVATYAVFFVDIAFNGTVRLRFEYYNSTGNRRWSAIVDKSILSTPFHAAFSCSGSTLGDCSIYLNGSSLSLVFAQAGSIGIGDYPFELRVGDPVASNPCDNIYSDFRFYKSTLSGSDVKKVAYGYVLDNEFVIVPMYSAVNNVLENYATSGAGKNLTVQNLAQTNSLIIPYSFGIVPLFTISVANPGLENLNLNVYASPPISQGRIGSFSNFKLLGSYTYDDTTTTFDVASGYADIYKNVPQMGFVVFGIQILDLETGQLPGKIKRPNAVRLLIGNVLPGTQP